MEETEHQGTDRCARRFARRGAAEGGDPGARPVPVSMGSPRSQNAEVDGLLVTYAWFPADTVLHAHVHERAVLGTMIRGSFDLLIGGRSRDCVPGTVLIEPAGERHENRVGTAGAEVIVVQPAADRDLPRECMRLLDRPAHFRDARIAALARRMTGEMDSVDGLARLALEGLALEMLAQAGARERNERRRTSPPPWLTRVCEVLHDRFLEGLTIDELAREAGVHPAHLTRVFRKHRGSSIGAYLRSLRLDWAAARLRGDGPDSQWCVPPAGEEPESLARIALRAGFADQSHFTREFRRHTGQTPARYRQQAGRG